MMQTYFIDVLPVDAFAAPVLSPGEHRYFVHDRTMESPLPRLEHFVDRGFGGAGFAGADEAAEGEPARGVLHRGFRQTGFAGDGLQARPDRGAASTLRLAPQPQI